ncbi:calponin homology domain-containing protein DDB_G0272472-like isoform X1 [Trichogramma pretiosum]|uniref:calponin homology domain-containing protein DDB_G0272472-like isoform X1 n=1 Tax=Trichogramma pretiosum TaxID=7493 RepID=UPI000C71BB50|nr:calponin homology domain-containing protein DDB_G0272472-like isoform X1 [Trichogramma pretiosum]
MVYESDFYTTRRPYSSSSSRPYVSSYSVTPIRGPYYLMIPYSPFLRSAPHMPYVAHKRLVSIVHSPVRIYHAGSYLPIKLHARVRPSIIAAELNRIRYLQRPSTKSYTEDYLNSRNYIDFDDETRDIRARTDNLLRKIHVFVPRPSVSDYEETTIPERLRSDDYVRRIINSKNTRKDIADLPWYSTPEKRDIGSGHLACIKYAGGRPQPRRRPYYTVGDLVPGDVKSDVNLMSFYSKNRKAAEDASPSIPVERHVEIVSEDRPASAASVTWADEVDHHRREEPATKEAEIRVEKTSELQAEIEVEPDVKKAKPTVQDNEETQEAQEYDENGMRKEPDEDTIKKVQEYLDKKAAEKKMEEERRAWELAERRRIAEEKEVARLAAIKLEEDQRIAEIKEQERLEAERQDVIAKAEAARHEAERMVEDEKEKLETQSFHVILRQALVNERNKNLEQKALMLEENEKLYNEAVLQAIADEQERQAKEREEEKKKQEEDEDKTANLVLSSSSGVVNADVVSDDVQEVERSVIENVDQDVEDQPYEVDQDEETQIEENVPQEEEEEQKQEQVEEIEIDAGAATAEPESEQASEPQAAELVSDVADAPKVHESHDSAGGAQGFDWSQYDSEPEEAIAEAPAHEEITTDGEVESQQFDEADNASAKDDGEEADLAHSDVNEEAPEVTEAKADAEQHEEERSEDEDDDDDHTVTICEIVDDEETDAPLVQEIQDEEEQVESEHEQASEDEEAKSVHETTDEE